MFKAILLRLCSVVAIGVALLLLGALMVFGVGLAVEFIALDFLIASGVVEGSSHYWKGVRMMYVVLMLPPIYINLFRTLSDDTQERIKSTAASIGMSALYVGDWIGKGMLLAMGAYLAYTTFII
ncbi:hypothetical protein ABMY12_20850 [Vibrio vulnificus]|uniref:hypothetical protein n=1 Tax=Vibrio vulnificus TaxID=672 RepID=UPI0040593AFC